MKENILNKVLVICCLVAVFGCKAKKQVAIRRPMPIPARHVDKFSLIRSKQVNFTTFSAKAKTSLNLDGSTNDCTLNIRINRDKEIWVSVTALLGIEVARAVITPDSIKVLNRLQRVYMKKPFNFIQSYTNDQVNYPMLQALLLGNAIPQAMNDSTNYQIGTTGDITLSGSLKKLVYKLAVGGQSLKVTQTNLSNQQAGQSLQINNGSFTQVNTEQVPSQIDIASVSGERKVNISLHYVKVDVNQPQDYPFNIPEKYTPAD